jgi:LysM repeat protein
MKTGWKLIRVMAGVPVVVGMCLTQGCYTEQDATTASAKTATVAPEKPVALSKEADVAVAGLFETKPNVTHPYVPKTRVYTVKANETISEIAKKEGVRWQDILAENPDLTKSSHLKKGQTIELPEAVEPIHTIHHATSTVKHTGKTEKKPVVKEEKTEKKDEAAAAPASSEGTYTVKQGDSIAKIAKAHHVKRSELASANKITDPSKIKVGQKLVIPGKSEAAAPAVDSTVPAATAAPTTPAPAVEAPAATAASAAPAAPAVPSVPGVPAPVAAAPVVAPAAGVAVAPATVPAVAPAAADKFQNYTVKEGEDLYAVAIRWGVNPSELKAVNNLTSTDLHAGQVLKIPVVTPTP